MDVVWMAKSNSAWILTNQKGQGVVEYILLIAVLTSIGYAFYNNRRFKELIKGTDGMFATMKKGMSYSYRYGRQFDPNSDFEGPASFEYDTNKHDLYFNSEQGQTRFFSGVDPYP